MTYNIIIKKKFYIYISFIALLSLLLYSCSNDATTIKLDNHTSNDNTSNTSAQQNEYSNNIIVQDLSKDYPNNNVLKNISNLSAYNNANNIVTWSDAMLDGIKYIMDTNQYGVSTNEVIVNDATITEYKDISQYGNLQYYRNTDMQLYYEKLAVLTTLLNKFNSNNKLVLSDLEIYDNVEFSVNNNTFHITTTLSANSTNVSQYSAIHNTVCSNYNVLIHNKDNVHLNKYNKTILLELSTDSNVNNTQTLYLDYYDIEKSISTNIQVNQVSKSEYDTAIYSSNSTIYSTTTKLNLDTTYNVTLFKVSIDDSATTDIASILESNCIIYAHNSSSNSYLKYNIIKKRAISKNEYDSLKSCVIDESTNTLIYDSTKLDTFLEYDILDILKHIDFVKK